MPCPLITGSLPAACLTDSLSHPPVSLPLRPPPSIVSSALQKLRKLNPTPSQIVYEKGGGLCRIIPSKGRLVETSTRPLMDKRTVFIRDMAIDSPELPTGVFTIVLASPNTVSSHSVRQWRKQRMGVQTVYMPCWDEMELQDFRRVVAPTAVEMMEHQMKGPPSVSIGQLTAQQVHARFVLFGGIIRMALLNDGDAERELKNALRKCDLSVISKSLDDTLDLLPESSSVLLHYDVDFNTFQVKEIRFASDEMRERVYKTARRRNISIIKNFIAESASIPKWRAPRSGLFEDLAHSLLQRGNQRGNQYSAMKVTNVHTKKRRYGGVELLEIPPGVGAAGRLSTIQQIAALGGGQYGQLAKANFSTVDSVLQPNFMFQMTTSESHDVGIQALIDFDGVLHEKKKKMNFVFVVPPEAFQRFKLGAFNPPEMLSLCSRDIECWVLELYPSESELSVVSLANSSQSMTPSSQGSPSRLSYKSSQLAALPSRKRCHSSATDTRSSSTKKQRT